MDQECKTDACLADHDGMNAQLAGAWGAFKDSGVDGSIDQATATSSSRHISTAPTSQW